jgi:transcription antitermination factor NusG
METTSHDHLVQNLALTSQLDYEQVHWYVVYTYPRHEKRVAERLEQAQVEYFLPLYRTTHLWADRRKGVELPLFPGYVFVRIALVHRLRVLETPSIVRFVGIGQYPTPMPENEVATLRRGLSRGAKVEPHPFLKIGERMRIKAGPFQGVEGVMIRSKNVVRVVLSIDLIMRSVAVEVEIADLEPVSSSIWSNLTMRKALA